MPKFKNDSQRMKHAKAKLIPKSMWFDSELFGECLDDKVLSLMKAKEASLIQQLEKLLPKLNNQWLKKQAWLAIALSHPNIELLTFQHIGKLFKFDEQRLFSLFIILGNMTLLNQFARQFSDSVLLSWISDNDYYVYRKAAENGHTNIMHWLENKAPDQMLDMVQAVDFAAYKQSARHGHLEVLQALEKKAPADIPAMISSQNYYPYRIAAANGHEIIMAHIEATGPELIQTMIKADDFYAFRKAFENNHLDLCHQLLNKSSACMAYAEAHVHEYGERIVMPHIKQRLFGLHREALNINANGVFDLTDTEQVTICFYMLRHLIRLNDRSLDDELSFLLNIPTIKSLAHRTINEGPENELLRLAVITGNEQAASILLNLPDVRVLAERHNFYRAEKSGQLNLQQLAKDRESSMTALTQGEKKRLDEAIKYYQPTISKLGVKNIINELRERLQQRYKENPASITTEDGTTLALPMTFAELEALKLNEIDYQKALIAYYQNKNHTAWRYLAKPNHWMHPDASYVYIDTRTGMQWSTFEEYQPLIALFWLAAGDKYTTPTDGHTFEGRIEHFIDELALIGRAHNWDSTRINDKGSEEEYDDLAGDRPSCFSGVKRRLFQSVLGHPLINILTADNVLEEMRSFARTHFELSINEDNQAKLRDAYHDYLRNLFDIGKESRALLTLLNIPDEKIDMFERYMVDKYGAQYADDPQFHRLVCNKLRVNGSKGGFFVSSHALKLDGLVGLYGMLNHDPVSTTETPKRESPSQSSFFAHKSRTHHDSQQDITRSPST